MIEIYCDGGCRGNQNKNNIGAYGARLLYKDTHMDIKQAFVNVTNNQMELMACIESLLKLKRYDIPVTIYSDSAYVVNGMNKWVYNWEKNGWKTSTKKDVENKELWNKLLNLSRLFVKIDYIKVKGHTGKNDGNSIADRLVNEAMDELEQNIKGGN